MSEYSADKIIESIAHVTTQADRELLEASLMSTLFELLKPKSILLYKIISEYDEKCCLIATEITDGKLTFHDPCEPTSQFFIHQITGLSQCIEKEKPVLVESKGKPGETETYVYPLINRNGTITSVFIICGKALSENENKRLLSGYFQIYRNYACLLDDSEHDTLTGLLNRRTFDRDLDRILAGWKRPSDQNILSTQQQPRRRNGDEGCVSNWLAVIDIDFFKKINDQYGHLYGDEVLLLLANIMRKTFRCYDKLFRFGGEEFVVLLRSTSQEGAGAALERFRAAMDNYDFPQIGSVTVSIGYVEIADQGIAAVILGHADSALYYAKDNGRNRVCFHTDLVDRGELAVDKPKIIESDVELF